MKVELIDHMGSDLSVCNAARVSFNKESHWECTTDNVWDDDFDAKLSDRDTKLIKYLAKHNHWTPFGHCFASFRIKAPIFVARQLAKHQVGLVWNEVSRRYVDEEPEFYVPESWRKRAENVKQGSSDEVIHNNEGFLAGYEELMSELVAWYNDAIANGICPEQARAALPQSAYTEWVWSGSLAAFARVCKLRLDPHTQYETRQVVAFIDNDMRSLFPVSWEALSNGGNV